MLNLYSYSLISNVLNIKNAVSFGLPALLMGTGIISPLYGSIILAGALLQRLFVPAYQNDQMNYSDLGVGAVIFGGPGLVVSLAYTKEFLNELIVSIMLGIPMDLSIANTMVKVTGAYIMGGISSFAGDLFDNAVRNKAAGRPAF